MAASWTTLALTHFAPALGAGDGSGRPLWPAIGGGAGYRGAVVDGADLGEAFAIALVALGEPALKLVGRRGGRLRGGWAQRVGSHHDALAIGRNDQQATLASLRSVVVRNMRCGEQGCACKAEPPALRGPYIQWTRTVEGETVTKFLSEDQLARYQPWFDSARRLKELIAMLQIASVHAVERHEGWRTFAVGH